MSGTKFMAATLCAAVVGGLGAYLARQSTVDQLEAQIAALQKQSQQAQADRKAALEKLAGSELELQNLRRDSMALAVLREKLKTNAPSLESPPGFFAGTNQTLYLTYATPDPVLRSFFRWVMGGSGDSKSK